MTSQKLEDCRMTARALVNLMQKNIRARDIMTLKAFENAIRALLTTFPEFFFDESPGV